MFIHPTIVIDFAKKGSDMEKNLVIHRVLAYQKCTSWNDRTPLFVVQLKFCFSVERQIISVIWRTRCSIIVLIYKHVHFHMDIIVVTGSTIMCYTIG